MSVTFFCTPRRFVENMVRSLLRAVLKICATEKCEHRWSERPVLVSFIFHRFGTSRRANSGRRNDFAEWAVGCFVLNALRCAANGRLLRPECARMGDYFVLNAREWHSGHCKGAFECAFRTLHAHSGHRKGAFGWFAFRRGAPPNGQHRSAVFVCILALLGAISKERRGENILIRWPPRRP